VFWLKTGRLFDENDIGVTISSRFQFAAEFCGGLFSASLTNEQQERPCASPNGRFGLRTMDIATVVPLLQANVCSSVRPPTAGTKR
jgi:hypothetical protein